MSVGDSNSDFSKFETSDFVARRSRSEYEQECKEH